ncbi:hypothetical protein HPB50_004596 [Hyalomma asiaticum]|uniref:Uncharacterized protein n=1 Tax=Hyalomma asiaticum TaxID=266040 RepID=A0ACB7TEZ6_HYAAI|nr:hypothetical protein HPB50_004596 [Hyalomma asiaticum]
MRISENGIGGFGAGTNNKFLVSRPMRAVLFGSAPVGAEIYDAGLRRPRVLRRGLFGVWAKKEGGAGEPRGPEPREREGKCPRCGSGRPAISDPDTSLRPGTVASTAASLAPCVVWAQLPTSPRPFAGPPPHPVLLT